MNSTDVLHFHRDRLAQLLAQHIDVPDLQPLSISPWLAMSLLQKAVRRGRGDLALRAGATLLVNAPDRLWRRLGGIAFEDVGLASPDTVGLVTAALGGKRLRAQLGGEWIVASRIIEELARVHKCRAADDLLMASDSHPDAEAIWRRLNRLPTSNLMETVTAQSTPLLERAVALRVVVGAVGRSLIHGPQRKGEAHAAFDHLCEAGYPHTVIAIAREGHRKTGEALAPLFALLSREPRTDVVIESDQLPPELTAGAVPSWSLDVYTREGRAAYAAFLKSDNRSARWVRAHVASARRVEFFGNIVFRVEGGALKNRVRWRCGDQLREQYEVLCAGPECPDATEIMTLVRADIPALNAIRAELNGGLAHA